MGGDLGVSQWTGGWCLRGVACGLVGGDLGGIPGKPVDWWAVTWGDVCGLVGGTWGVLLLGGS